MIRPALSEGELKLIGENNKISRNIIRKEFIAKSKII
jgi:hypothetical protein